MSQVLHSWPKGKQKSKSSTNSDEKPSEKTSKKPESNKRSASMSSERSNASTSNERISRPAKCNNPQPKRPEECKLSYDNTEHALLNHTNGTARIKIIQDNRLSSAGGSVTGTCIVNDSQPPILHSVTMKKSDSKCRQLYNPQGSQKTTMVYGKLFEDVACRPKEYTVWCEQCTSNHPVHNQDACLII